MVVSSQIICFLFLAMIDILHADLTSTIFYHNPGTDFVPLNHIEFLGVHSPILTSYSCSFLCHQNPQCRTFVFDPPTCRLYEGLRQTGQIITSLSNTMVGEILYDNINLSSSYNKSCDHCYPDRYLVCTNNQCQCPPNTFWNGQDKCVNQQFVVPALPCNSDNYCREDLNLTCCITCQCPLKTFWNNQECVLQFTADAPCNTSDQCRNDLQLVCSKINKTCISMTPSKLNVTNGTVPAIFSNFGITLNLSGVEWWRAFDNNIITIWNTMCSGVPNYLLITFDNEYLITSFQLESYGDTTHDAHIVEFYLDENATCLVGNFSFPVPSTLYYTFPATTFNYSGKPVVTKQILLSVTRWSYYQLWLPELAFFGIPY